MIDVLMLVHYGTEVENRLGDIVGLYIYPQAPIVVLGAVGRRNDFIAVGGGSGGIDMEIAAAGPTRLVIQRIDFPFFALLIGQVERVLVHHRPVVLLHANNPITAVADCGEQGGVEFFAGQRRLGRQGVRVVGAVDLPIEVADVVLNLVGVKVGVEIGPNGSGEVIEGLG